jgi:hypothetical protein
MSNLPSAIRTSLLKLQNTRTKLYLNTAKQFTSNRLIHLTWLSLAGGVNQQTATLKSLPSSFWKLLDGQDARMLLDAIGRTLKVDVVMNGGETSLKNCFTQTLDLEEPVIVEIFAPIVRILKANWTEQALDIYIMARSHLTQLIRLIEPFCGEPSLIQRCTLLVQRFEQEVQRVPAIESKGTLKARKVSRKAARKTAAKRERHAVAARPPHIVQHPKPLVREIKLARRRARG